MITRSQAPAMAFGFARDMIDRAAHLRTDAAALAIQLGAENARAFVVCGDALVLRKVGAGHSALHVVAVASDLCAGAAPIFLGLDATGALFAFPRPSEQAPLSGDFTLADLRAIATQGLVPAHELGAMAAAKSLVQWHARHGFCANCGAPTHVTQAGWRRDCPACHAEHFPRTDPVAIMAVGDETRCLLGRQVRFPEGMWSCLAGFVEPGETVEDAVRREVFEEAGIVCDDVTLFATQPWPYPSSLMIGAFARAQTFDIQIDPDELEAARWFGREELRTLFDGTHPQGLKAPPPFAIAHHLLRRWLDGVD